MFFATVLIAAVAGITAAAEPSLSRALAMRAADVLQSKFFTWYGLWDCGVFAARETVSQPRKAGSWWNCANSLEALANEVAYSGNTTYAGVFSRTWYSTAAQHPIHKEFSGLDDIQWWALAWLRVSEVSGNASYLSRSRDIFDEVTKYWDDTCGGGVWWDRKRSYKNAITNELFITLAAALHQKEGGTNSSYLDWALRGWRWFNATGMLTTDGIVDGLGGAPACSAGGAKYTYNQGVILGGLGLLHDIEANSAYLDAATRIADAALHRFGEAKGGILTEDCEPDCNHDGEQFKGIFVRYLGYLATRLPAATRPRKKYARTLLANVNSLIANATNGDGAFGLQWGGPVGEVDGITHTSGFDLLNAAVVAAA